MNASPTSPLKEFFHLAAGLLGIGLVGLMLLGFAVDFMVPRISPGVEKKMAGVIIAHMDLKKSGSPAEAYLQSLADSMGTRCERLPYALQVYVDPSKMVNAVALPFKNPAIENILRPVFLSPRTESTPS